MRLKPLALTSLLIFMTSVMPAMSALGDGEKKAQVKARAGAYYESLQASQWDRSYSFMSAAMRDDTPQDRYIAGVDRTFKSVRVTTEPKVQSLGKTGSENRPFVVVVARLTARTSNDQVVPFLHRTTWIWEQPSDRAVGDWFLARDEVTEQTSAPPSTTTSRR